MLFVSQNTGEKMILSMNLFKVMTDWIFQQDNNPKNNGIKMKALKK